MLLSVVHNLQFTKPNECRYDVCLLVPGAKDIATEDQVEIRNLCGGKYAVFTIDHTADAVANFWQSFSTEMYSCGLTMDISRPIMERYSVKMVTNGLCEMCVPVLNLGTDIQSPNYQCGVMMPVEQ